MASEHETVFTMEATPVKFGAGASAEAGWECRRLGIRRAMVVSDPGLSERGIPQRIIAQLEAEGIEVVLSALVYAKILEEHAEREEHRGRLVARELLVLLGHLGRGGELVQPPEPDRRDGGHRS